VDAFVEDENACKVAWAVYVIKDCVTGLAISRSSIYEPGSDLRNKADMGDYLFYPLPFLETKKKKKNGISCSNGFEQ